MIQKLLSKISGALAISVVSTSTLLAQAPPAPPGKPIQLKFETNAVVAENATPQADVVLFGVSREIDNEDFTTLHRWSLQATAAADGVARFEFSIPVPGQSVFLVVDLGDGRYDVSVPRGAVRHANWRGRGIGRRSDGRDSVIDGRTFTEVAVARPKVGAWVLSVVDGGAADEDGLADNQIEAALDRMEPVEDGPPAPSQFLRDDIVALFDLGTREITLVKVGEPQ